jgi:cyanate lyase
LYGPRCCLLSCLHTATAALWLGIEAQRVANPKGDRVRITRSGKFLPYRYYEASGNVPEYGHKEE